jgi:hypothetical protein
MSGISNEGAYISNGRRTQVFCNEDVQNVLKDARENVADHWLTGVDNCPWNSVVNATINRGSDERWPTYKTLFVLLEGQRRLRQAMPRRAKLRPILPWMQVWFHNDIDLFMHRDIDKAVAWMDRAIAPGEPKRIPMPAMVLADPHDYSLNG